MSLPNSNAYSALGGEIRDYQPPEDPTTDLSAEESNETRADVAAMTRMIPRAMVTITSDGTTTSVVDHDAVWGNDISVKPTVSRVTDGTYTVTWPSTVTDARGHTYALNLRRGVANADANPNGYIGMTLRLSPNSFSVATFSSVDVVFEDSGEPVTVWVW